VLFLDMSMPTLNGAELLQLLKRKPEVIITTAYPEYALDAFNLDATDYLVKPIGFARFLRAIGKLKRMSPETHYLPAPDDTKVPFIFVKASEGGIRIEIQDITFIRGMGDYLKIFLVSGKPVLVLSNFKNMLEKLPPYYFMRVHNSYVVNISHIVGVQRNRILISDERIPLGESYRKAFFDRIKL
ncbi:MAG TPA: LytTR family DNA-binding domain-containing protein, partial [Flavobacterium sp.]|nr:LytTR family DNA-binding domain-containing protein [Flavobacterium sp.]